jgi:hypothetical protein
MLAPADTAAIDVISGTYTKPHPDSRCTMIKLQYCASVGHDH